MQVINILILGFFILLAGCTLTDEDVDMSDFESCSRVSGTISYLSHY
jgi:hypothetical protein